VTSFRTNQNMGELFLNPIALPHFITPTVLNPSDCQLFLSQSFINSSFPSFRNGISYISSNCLR
jgi:hypothetical protein